MLMGSRSSVLRNFHGGRAIFESGAVTAPLPAPCPKRSHLHVVGPMREATATHVQRDGGALREKVRAMSSGYALWLVAMLTSACGSAPLPAEPERTAPPQPAGRARSVSDDCAPEAGKPPPAPLERQYEGLAKAARCQRGVYTIMGGVTHLLGVKDVLPSRPDYRPDHRSASQRMARELGRVARRQAAKGGQRATWSGRGTPRSGNPPRRALCDRS